MSGKAYLADCHLHSRISPDARFSMTEMAEAGIAAGMDELCFTDHADLAGTWLGWVKTRAQWKWEELLPEFEAAQAAVGDRIRLHVGIELGDVFCNRSGAEAWLDSAPPLDFVIGSVHVLSEKMKYADLSKMRPRDEGKARAAMEDYLALVLDLAAWGRCSVLGHLTLPLRYFNENCGYHLTYDGYEAEIAEILRTAIQNGMGLELNANRGNAPIPDGKWLRLYRDLGGEIVTLGTDAHSPRHVGAGIRECQELLKECGFTRFCTFEGMKPVFHELV